MRSKGTVPALLEGVARLGVVGTRGRLGASAGRGAIDRGPVHVRRAHDGGRPLRTPDGPDSWDASTPLGRPSVDAGPLGVLPSLDRRQVRLEQRLGPDGSRLGPGGLLAVVANLLGEELEADRFEVLWRGCRPRAAPG